MRLAEEHVSHIGRVKVGFSISSVDLDPNHITSILGISPSTSARRGDPRINRKGNIMGGSEAEGHWLVESTPAVCSKDINDHFAFILERLLPVSQKIKDLSQRAETFFDIFWESSYLYAGTGPIISATNLEGVAKLGAGIGFDILQIDEAKG